MRVVVDLQAVQGSNRDRGIGQYSLSLTLGLARLRGANELIVVLSALFPETIEPLRAVLEDILPADAIRIMHLVGPVAHADEHSDARREAAELMREQFIASLFPDFVLVPSLFEGLGDNVVTSIGKFSTSLRTAVILHDLIPLVHSEIYLKDPTIAKWYMRKLAALRDADLLLANSQSSRLEAIQWLGVEDDKVISISTGADDYFTAGQVSEDDSVKLRRSYGIVRPFIMYTGGIDHRKNIEGLIEAYSMMPSELRIRHQLVIVCSIDEWSLKRLTLLASSYDLAPDEVVFTGYITKYDLRTCYRACKLFVFPSWHEGFGLPVLEAMRCGRAVIAGNRSSLPEVVGDSSALFDPYDVEAISKAISEVLTNDALRAKLEKHGLKQATLFSWDLTCEAAWKALTAENERCGTVSTKFGGSGTKPRLAYISPLPPEASGISDYSAELLPELARHYQIDVVVHQEKVSDISVVANYPIRSVEWFKRHAAAFDRILYHFGNSHFHSHMFDLIRLHPGVVVLHDFFLSGIVAHRDVHNEEPGGWARELFEAHGWPAVVHRAKAADTADVVWAYPCNATPVQNALGMIVHSDFSRRLAGEYWGGRAGSDWALIPHLRQPILNMDRAASREVLGLRADDFVVCSFGVLGPLKMNNRLLSAWLKSPLVNDPNCRLVLVGQNNPGAYGDDLQRRIANKRAGGRIKITGWTDQATYRHWLAAADIAVQLRTLSRGETSGTILDCMNAAIPTIVNANGSVGELPNDSVWLMPDDFSDENLVEALSALRADDVRRREIGARARAQITSHHNPRRCAAAYASAIEDAYARADTGLFKLTRTLINRGDALTAEDWRNLAQTMGRNAPQPLRRKRLFVDISELVQRDVGTGIQRVVRSILKQWLTKPPADYIVEPVYAVIDEKGYRYARQFTSRMLDIWPFWCEDEVVEPLAGDNFLGLDLQPFIVPQQQDLLQEWRQMGVTVRFVIYDLLAVISPEYFFPGARAGHHTWLQTISQFDGVICISRAVAEDYREWLDRFGPPRVTPLEIDWFHLGADNVDQKTALANLPAEAEALLVELRSAPSFLSVATIEPRKGFTQTLEAMETLWARGVMANFVIVGKPGWMMDDFIDRLQTHPQLGTRLFWLNGISDEFLSAIYKASYYLVAASEGEGFGLPLIEAARHDLAILARDIPVFREVAADAVTYFPDSKDAAILARALEMLLARQNSARKRPRLKWLTWAQSADALLANATRDIEPYQKWMPDGVRRYWGSDHRLQSDVGISDGTCVRTSGHAGFLAICPALSLDPGHWAIKAEGNVTSIDGSEFLEVLSVLSDAGNTLCLRAPLRLVGDNWVVEGTFELAKQSDDVEIRLWVSSSTKLSLDGICLAPSVSEASDGRIEAKSFQSPP